MSAHGSVAPGLRIVHEDEGFCVVLKPGGLLSVPGRTPENQDCVVSRFLELYPEAPPQCAVHRLDWETSGLLLMARTKEAHRALSMQFEARTVQKRYVAVVDGVVEAEGGRIELPFRLDVDNRPYQIYDPIHGKLGVTDWKNLGVEDFGIPGTDLRRLCTRIDFYPVTGRTHQLRLHAMHPEGLGFPIVGDCLYGTGKDVNELRLHAAFLAFDHPLTGERLAFEVAPEF
jgi:tRNA pseudouridine32 synthase/23S rRNA pseudouridine746 synthase